MIAGMIGTCGANPHGIVVLKQILIEVSAYRVCLGSSAALEAVSFAVNGAAEVRG